MMQLKANSHSLLLFQADFFVRGLTLSTNTVVENLCMRPNIGPAAAGPAGPVATALHPARKQSRSILTTPEPARGSLY